MKMGEEEKAPVVGDGQPTFISGKINPDHVGHK